MIEKGITIPFTWWSRIPSIDEAISAWSSAMTQIATGKK